MLFSLEILFPKSYKLTSKHATCLTRNVFQMFVYFDVFNLFFEESLPPLFSFFTHIQLTPDLYLIGWYVWFQPLYIQVIDSTSF